jgi:ribosomal protein L28
MSTISSQYQSNKDDYALSNGDIALCASNVLGFASSFILMKSNITNPMELLTRSPLELAVIGAAYGTSVLADLVSSIGESSASISSLSDVTALAPALLLTTAKAMIGRKMLSQPILSPVLLGMNAHSTYAIVKRAYVELGKCWNLAQSSKGDQHLLIARNTLVHTINSSSSIYRMWTTFNYCKEYFLPNFSTEFTLRGSSGISRDLSKEQQIDKLIELSETKKPEERLCDVCAPACAVGLSQRSITAAKKECARYWQLNIHPDKVVNSLKEKANLAFNAANEALLLQRGGSSQLKDSEFVVEDLLARADAAERVIDPKTFRVVPNPTTVLSDLQASIDDGQKSGTTKYPYQIRRLIDEHVKTLSGQISKVMTAIQNTQLANAKALLCQDVVAKAQICEDIIDSGGSYKSNKACTDELFSKVADCMTNLSEIKQKGSPILDLESARFLYQVQSSKVSRAQSLLETSAEFLKKIHGCAEKAWV